MPSERLRTRVEARPGTALPHGLLSVATLLPMVDSHEQLGVDWQPLTCGVASTTGWCPPDPGDPDREKSFNVVESESTPPVTTYAGVECSVVGWTYDEAVERARAILNVGEQSALETWAWEEILAPASTVVSTGAEDESVVGRLAALEAALADGYGGVGIVHVPIALGAFMSAHGLLVREGSRLRTHTGHLVAIGAGYTGERPAGDPPPDGSAWMMISGPVTVRQGEVSDTPDEEAAAHKITTNDRLALAERTSVVQVECDVFAALASKVCCSDVTGS